MCFHSDTNWSVAVYLFSNNSRRWINDRKWNFFYLCPLAFPLSRAFATCGLKVKCLKSGRSFPLLYLNVHRTIGSFFLFFSVCGPLEGCPLAFWSYIKEEMGRKRIIDFAFCQTQTPRTEKHVRKKGVGSGAGLSLVREPEGGKRLWRNTAATTMPRICPWSPVLTPSLTSLFLSSLDLMGE